MNPDFESIPLRDIHLPGPVSWWPPAPGWWISAALLLLLVAAVFVVRALRKKQQLKRAALAEFNSIVSQYHEQGNPQQLINQLSVLLRRLSVSRFPSQRAAGLTGQDWLAFLDQTAAQYRQKMPSSFASDIGEQLISVPYRQHPQIDREKVQPLIEMCRQWIAAVSRSKAPVVLEGGT
ncbi:MAG: DUF4381 domain-containing protein [Gammaproteobacteria bacterium]|jgi:hypothetical protein